MRRKKLIEGIIKEGETQGRLIPSKEELTKWKKGGLKILYNFLLCLKED